jgi:sensor histidine kinase YesM
LSIAILDDGVGVRARRSRERSRGTGLGLTNTSTRLKHLYGENHEFHAGPRDEGGYAVRMMFPFKLGRPPAAPGRDDPVGARNTDLVRAELP